MECQQNFGSPFSYPHIWKKIFLKFDCSEVKRMRQVCRAWRDYLDSQVLYCHTALQRQDFAFNNVHPLDTHIQTSKVDYVTKAIMSDKNYYFFVWSHYHLHEKPSNSVAIFSGTTFMGDVDIGLTNFFWKLKIFIIDDVIVILQQGGDRLHTLSRTDLVIVNLTDLKPTESPELRRAISCHHPLRFERVNETPLLISLHKEDSRLLITDLDILDITTSSVRVKDYLEIAFDETGEKLLAATDRNVYLISISNGQILWTRSDMRWNG